jgi:putative ABC transport system ATP-binding protein
MAGLDTITAGSARIGGTELNGLGDRRLTQLRRDRVGFIFQSYNLLPMLNALENIRLPMDVAGRHPDPAWLRQVIDTVGLAGRLRHRPAQLSGGQQLGAHPSPQGWGRVAVARALAGKPDIIFGDEPTGNLDSAASSEILGFLRNSVRELGQTVVMVTHDPVAAGYADRVVFLADGRVAGEMANPTAERVLEHIRRAEAQSAGSRGG